MAFNIKDYSPDDLADILAGTQEILNTTWELSLLPKGSHPSKESKLVTK